MARQASAIEINQFIAGLVTDANPLTFPDNASLEEENFILNIDGSRRRRLGLDFETDYQEITTTIADADTLRTGSSSFRWTNAGGDAAKSILVIQLGNEVKFFDLDMLPISSGLIYTFAVPAANQRQVFNYAVVDGILVMVTGEHAFTFFEFDAPSTITSNTRILKVRDLFGVEDVIGVDLFDSLATRPVGFTSAHLYNLRNQTWAIPRVESAAATVNDPITHFRSLAGAIYPSNSDSVNYALYADPSHATNKTIERFFADDLIKNPIGNVKAPTGFFIIDALKRGTDRMTKEADLRATYTTLDFAVSSLAQDETPGGASCVSEFAGRVFYSGFSGEITGRDNRSPRMSSYVLFSRLVQHTSQIGQCYQENDPTNKAMPDLLPTDGGFIRIDGAYGILALKNVGTSLLVCATNGVWRIYGGNDYGFDATNFVVERVTDHGIVSVDSLVLVDNTLMFFGEDGIYHVHQTDNGGWTTENISFGHIQRLYEDIPIEDKQTAKGAYDRYERKVRWVYYNRLDSQADTKELILDINLKAYYLNSIRQFVNNNMPRLLSPFIANPYVTVFDELSIVVNGVDVVASGIPVIIGIDNILGNAVKEVGYLVVTQITPVVKYTFASYQNAQWRDWFSVDGAGVDASAFMVTGYIADNGQQGKDFGRKKKVPLLFVHCNRTELGFEELPDGDFTPFNPSSCIVQARWEWSDSANSKRWGVPFQAYRYKRLYFPVDVNDDYDTGFATIVTRNRLRGYGKVLSIKFSTEADHDLHLYGWSMQMDMNTNG